MAKLNCDGAQVGLLNFPFLSKVGNKTNNERGIASCAYYFNFLTVPPANLLTDEYVIVKTLCTSHVKLQIVRLQDSQEDHIVET